jgi:hypothetical protein
MGLNPEEMRRLARKMPRQHRNTVKSISPRMQTLAHISLSRKRSLIHKIFWGVLITIVWLGGAYYSLLLMPGDGGTRVEQDVQIRRQSN